MCKARSRKDSGCSGWRCGRWKNKHRPTAQASRSNDCNTKIPRAGRTNRRTARQSSTLSGCSPANHKTWRDSAHFWARNTYFLLLHQHCGGAAGCSQAADCGTLHRNKYLFDNVVCPLATSVGHEADSTSIALLQTKVWLILHGVATVLDHPQARGRGRKGGSATERRARPISQSRSIRFRCEGRGQRQCCRQDQHAASHPVDARAQRPMESECVSWTIAHVILRFQSSHELDRLMMVGSVPTSCSCWHHCYERKQGEATFEPHVPPPYSL